MPIIGVNGCNFFYCDDDFSSPWTPHDTVFLQPNFMGDHTHYRPWVPYLGADSRVIRMDRRGSGNSSMPSYGFKHDPDVLLADFINFLDALGIEKVHYVGDSLGGMLGVMFAAEYPERVTSLTLLSTPCYIREITQKGFLRPGYPDAVSALMGMGSWLYLHTSTGWKLNSPSALRSGAGKGSAEPEETEMQRARRIYNAERTALAPAHVIASRLRMVDAPEFTLMPILKDVKAPTLLLSPDGSPHTPPDEQALVARLIPNCRQVVIEGSGHLLVADHVERAASETRAFIAEHPSYPSA
jgi:3-oxoadipate enol-lactonase